MTLGDGKRKVLTLIDEYSSGGQVTADEDIGAKMADFFDMAQKQVANIKRIVHLYTVPRAAGVTEYAMPEDYLRTYRVWRDGETSGSRYRWKNGKIIIPETDDAAIIEVEYFASPTTIDADTPDTYAFEVEEDAAQCMPFFVAAQQLIVDLVVDYSALLGMYNMMLSTVDTKLPGSGAVVKNTFYVL